MKFESLEQVQEFFPCFKIGIINNTFTVDVIFYKEDQTICVTSCKLEKAELEENELIETYYQILNEKEYKLLQGE